MSDMNFDRNLDSAVLARGDFAAALFDRLHEGSFDGVGITRASYGDGEQHAHRLMAQSAMEIGLEVSVDAAGNTYMTLAGTNRAAPPVVVGSHLDSVAQGGNFDGAAGVVSGLTVCGAMRDAGFTPARDIRVMGIRAEESAWFGVSYIGSRSALGVLPEGALDEACRIDTGRSLAQHMAAAGCAPDRLRAGEVYLPPDRVHAYVEVHIEQGPVLTEAGLPVGVVTGIRGNRRLPRARCLGEYSHCGGMPRRHRRDAVIATAELVGELDRIWSECEAAGQDFAFTVGKLFTDAEWHAMTKIAGEVGFSLDMRSLDADFLAGMEQRLRDLAADIGARRGVSFELGDYTRAAPGVLDAVMRGSLADGARALEIPSMPIASGASHDAAAFAAAGVPTAMVFIRNDKGSHNPDEAMTIEDFLAATRLLGLWLAGDHRTARGAVC